MSRPPDDRPAVLHVINTLEGGGTERTLLAILQQLDHHNMHHIVATLRDAGQLSRELPDTVACHALGYAGPSRTAGIRLATIARRRRVRLIHARNTGCWFDALAAGSLSGSKVVLGFHGLEYEGRFARRHRRLARAASHLGARFTTVCDAGKDKLCVEIGVPLDRIEVLRNGVRLDRFVQSADRPRRAIRSAMELKDTDCAIGSVGALTAVKNHELLISAVAEAVHQLPGLHLVIVGDGPLRSALTSRAMKAGLADRVHFTGWREDIPAMLSAMDVYVCCSTAEGVSNALLEAMASGLATITTGVGDHAAIVRHERDGLVTRPHCAADLAAAIRRLAADHELRAAFARAAPQRAHMFTFDRTVRAYAEYYGKILAPPPRRRRRSSVRYANVAVGT